MTEPMLNLIARKKTRKYYHSTPQIRKIWENNDNVLMFLLKLVLYHRSMRQNPFVEFPRKKLFEKLILGRFSLFFKYSKILMIRWNMMNLEIRGWERRIQCFSLNLMGFQETGININVFEIYFSNNITYKSLNCPVSL